MLYIGYRSKLVESPYDIWYVMGLATQWFLDGMISVAPFSSSAFSFILRPTSGCFGAGRWNGSFSGVAWLAFVYGTVLVGTDICLGIGEAL